MIDSLVIRHNKRATNLRLSINKKGQPVLTIPRFCSEKKALQWAESYQPWIEEHRFIPTVFIPNQNLPLCGQNVTLIHIPEQHLNYQQGDKIYIGGEIAHFNRRTHTFIKQVLLSYLTPIATQMAQKLGVKFHHITIRDTHTRWGSCSNRGNLSFSGRLALCPPRIIEYLVAHEVSHLKHMNHGPEFWQTVATLTPHMRTAKEWLRHHGQF